MFISTLGQEKTIYPSYKHGSISIKKRKKEPTISITRL